MRRIMFLFLFLCCMATAASVQAATSIQLIIERHASLTEQVLFESDLQQLPQVQAVIPVRLNARHREYRLILINMAQTGWLGHWLEQHGYQARKNELGWLAY